LFIYTHMQCAASLSFSSVALQKPEGSEMLRPRSKLYRRSTTRARSTGPLPPRLFLLPTHVILLPLLSCTISASRSPFPTLPQPHRLHHGAPPLAPSSPVLLAHSLLPSPLPLARPALSLSRSTSRSRARYMPQNPCVMATKGPSESVFVFDYTKARTPQEA
jgi:hypothetical protein